MTNLNTFVRDLYDTSYDSMLWWKESLQKEYKENIYTISNTISLLENFFGESIKDNIKIIVLTSGSKEDIQGSVISNYTESKSPYFKGIDESLGDVEMYFSLIQDGISVQPVRSVLSSIIHEAIHLRLQKKEFFNLISQVEKDRDIKEVVKKLKENSGRYMEISMELITQYLTSYVEYCIKNNISNGSKDRREIFEYVLDYEIFEKLISSTIMSHVKYEKLDGAASRIFSNYINLVGYIPKEVKEEYEILTKESKGDTKDWRENSLNIYKMAYKFDLGLINDYMDKGRSIDKSFIIKMYDLVKQEIN